MDYENKIETPFSAKDSELCGCEYTIPEGYEAEIKDGKVIIRKKESEDEKARKSLLKYLKDMCKNTSTPFSLDNAKLWIAWLEKQDEQKPQKNQNANIEWGIDFITGEMHFNNLTLEQAEELRNALLGKQNPADKVEPKYAEIVRTNFKDGDWVVYQNETFQVRILPNGSRLLQGEKYQTYFIDELCRPWTIQDAKDGDVLCCESGWTCIFKTLVNDETFSSYCFMDDTKWFCETGSESHTLKEEFVKAYNGKIHPATKEQRDLLFQKMREAGYEWDTEKLELKKVEQKSVKVPKFKVGDFIQFKGMGHTRYTVKEVCGLSHYINTCNKRMDMSYTDANFELVEQKPAEWTAEDEKLINSVIELIDNGALDRDEKDYFIEKLKSLKERVQPQNIAYYNPYKEVVESIAKMCKHYNNMDVDSLEDFYDNVKVKCKDAKEYDSLFPQNTWKPSEEQLEALDSATENCAYSEYQDCLRGLIEQLKKLREE